MCVSLCVCVLVCAHLCVCVCVCLCVSVCGSFHSGLCFFWFHFCLKYNRVPFLVLKSTHRKYHHRHNRFFACADLFPTYSGSFNFSLIHVNI